MFKQRRARGFGFVKFLTREEADAAFEAQPHTIKNKVVELKCVPPNSLRPHPESNTRLSARRYSTPKEPDPPEHEAPGPEHPYGRHDPYHSYPPPHSYHHGPPPSAYAHEYYGTYEGYPPPRGRPEYDYYGRPPYRGAPAGRGRGYYPPVPYPPPPAAYPRGVYGSADAYYPPPAHPSYGGAQHRGARPSPYYY